MHADAFRKIVGKEGVIGLYRGYAASILSYIPAAAVSWATYEFVKQKLYKYEVDLWLDKVWGYLFAGRPNTRADGDLAQKTESHIINFFSGMTGGVLASVVVNPMDVAKTRLQTDTYIRDATRALENLPLQHLPGPSPVSGPLLPIATENGMVVRKYTGLLCALRMMVKEEGPAALMKGVLPRIMFFAPLAGMQYSIYNLAKQLSCLSDEEIKVPIHIRSAANSASIGQRSG